eukprot:TRINITY_DN2583_c0_g1_i1.p1 TRINITY_DN2583_c0_g1~~TRINITY_DN2583_c0_g1_i1.p1  ORF type:complete len:359 (-),score=113.56 TRINITY_DN2583_c0_g1_i1:230-1306(-)
MIRGVCGCVVATTVVQAARLGDDDAASEPQYTGAHALKHSKFRIMPHVVDEPASFLEVKSGSDACAEKACWKWDWDKPSEDPHTWQPHCSPESTSLMQTEHEFSTLEKEGYKLNYAMGQPSQGFYDTEYKAWEPETFEVFRTLAKDKVALDIGTWVGPTSLWLAHAAKKVVSVEPTQTAFAELCANYEVNPDIKDKMIPVNAALDNTNRVAVMSNRGNSADHLVDEKAEAAKTDASLIEQQTKKNEIKVQTISIDSLVQQHTVLAETGFVKMDTEGYERVLVPALEGFFKEKKPNAYISLHPQYNSHEVVQGTVDKLKDIFPYLYEADMKTPFKTDRSSYAYGDHGGSDVVCSWTPLV